MSYQNGHHSTKRFFFSTGGRRLLSAKLSTSLCLLFYRPRKDSPKLKLQAKILAPRSATDSKGVMVGPNQPITVQLHQFSSNPQRSIQEDGEIPHCSTSESPSQQIHTAGSSNPVNKQVQQGPLTKNAHQLLIPKHASTHPSNISTDHSCSMRSWNNLAPVERPEDEEPQAMASPSSRLPRLNRPKRESRLPPLNRPRRRSLWKTMVQGEEFQSERRLPK